MAREMWEAVVAKVVEVMAMEIGEVVVAASHWYQRYNQHF